MTASTPKHFETLEDRRLMTAVTAALDLDTNVLNITGTPAADVVSVSWMRVGTAPAQSTDLVVRAGGTVVYSRPVAAGLPAKVVADLGDGDDTFTAFMAITSPMAVDGGNGDDKLTGGGGADVMTGGAGNDTLFNSTGDDVFNGGAGQDAANYRQFYNTSVSADGVADDGMVQTSWAGPRERDNVMPDVEDLVGGSGVDVLTASREAAVASLFGHEGADVLTGGPGNDILSGGDANDTLNGGSGNDALYGDGGDDALDGGVGADRLFGGLGTDRLAGVSGDDVLDGGAGDDVLDVTFDLGAFVRNRGRSIAASARAHTKLSTGRDTLVLKLDAGPLVGTVLRPIVAKVQQVTRGLQPFANLYDRPIPVASKIDGNLTFGRVLDPAGKFRAVVNTINAVNALVIPSAAGLVDLGTFNVSSFGVTRVGTANPFLGSVLAGTIGKLSAAGLDFPVLKDPTSAAKMVLGQNVDLVTYTLPTLDVSRSFNTGSRTFWLGPVPVTAKFGVAANLHASGKVGVDLAGVRAGNVIEGFFVTAYTSAVLTLSVNGSAGVGLRFASAGVLGSVTGRAALTLNDPNHDGKVRVSEMRAIGNPFNVAGTISYDVSLYAKFFSKRWTKSIDSGTFRF